MKRLIYICTPYTHPEPIERERRYKQAVRASAAVLRMGHFPYSPIVNSHPLVVADNLPVEFSAWAEWDYHMIDLCDLLMVVKIEGWEKSAGIKQEMQYAKRYGIAVIEKTMEELEQERDLVW